MLKQDHMVSEFYNKNGDALVSASNYPEEIGEFLSTEADMLRNLVLKNNYDCIIEVGCMEARSLELVRGLGKIYHGIDIVTRYIDVAKMKIKFSYNDSCATVSLLSFFQLDANSLPELSKYNSLLYFPFNSFGNLGDFDMACKKLRSLKIDAFISTYKTSDLANKIRYDYYSACGYSDIKLIESKYGVQFTSNENLNVVAYYKDQLSKNLIFPGTEVGFYEDKKLFRGIHVEYNSGK